MSITKSLTAPALPRAQKLMSNAKRLKDVSVDFSDAKKGTHRLVETYEGRSNPLWRGAKATKTTTVSSIRGSEKTPFTTTSTNYQPGQLTRAGKYTAGGATVAGYSSLAVLGSRNPKSRKVKKNMDGVSYWGVDHGVEISKAGPKLDKNTKLRTGEKVGAYTLGGIYGGVRAKKGRKAAVVGRMTGRTMAEGYGGALAGAGLGAATRHPLGPLVGANVGSTVGGVHGALSSFRNAKRRGDIKMPGQPGR